MGGGSEFVLKMAKKASSSANILHRGTWGLPVSLRWSLKSQLNPHLAPLAISSLYVLKLMENSAAACDDYQPAPEDRAARKGWDGWRWRGKPEKKREVEVRGRWAHEESWEKELLLTCLSSGDTVLSPFSWLPPRQRLGCFFPVCPIPPPPLLPPFLESVIRPPGGESRI